MSDTMSDTHITERALLLVVSHTYFSAKAEHVAGTRLAGRTRRAREFLGRIMVLYLLPTCLFILLETCM